MPRNSSNYEAMLAARRRPWTDATKEEAEAFEPIDSSKITRVYSGQAGRCCCGCCGKYSNTHRSINLICRKIDKLTKEGYKRQDSDLYFSLDTETRRYIAYRR